MRLISTASLPVRSGGRRRPRPAAVLLAAAAAVVAFALPRPASAVDDPNLEYRSIQTDHFYVHYPDKLRGFARRTAEVAEEAHRILTPLMGEDPEGRTHVVVNDDVDTANGSANVFGRRVINIYAMPPAPSGVLGYYTDWLRILVYHEYAHILHLTTESEFLETLNDIVGDVLHPNALLPRWYVEGLAVMYESRLTGSGRNHSSLFQMWLRAAALEDRLFSIGTVSGSPVSWPQGTAPYLYGGSFVEYIVDRYGLEFVRNFNRHYGDRAVPYALNVTAEEAGGDTFHRMWQEWAAHQKGKAFARHVVTTARGRTPTEQITDGGGTRRHPHVRPGTDEVTYYHNGLESHAHFASTRTTTRSSEALFEVDGAVGSSDWTADGEHLVYGRGAVENSVYVYQDLFMWDPNRERHYRITEQERARDPAISPEGDRIAYVRIQPGTADLVVCEFAPRDISDCRTVLGGTLHPADDERHWQQIATPTWTPDGEALVVSRWRLEEKQRDLWRVDLVGDEAPTAEPITDDPAQDTAPTYGPDGYLYWSSDRTGVFNVYARSPANGEVSRVTNTDTGLFQPAVTRNERWIYAVGYTSEGYELVRFPRPSQFGGAAPESYAAHERPDFPDIDRSGWSTSDYQPLRWFDPLWFRPNVGAFTGGAGFGGTLVGGAPIGHHEYRLSAAVLTTPGFADPRLNIGARYSWTGGPFNLNLSAALRDQPREQSYFAESRFVPYIRREYRGSIGITYPVQRIDDSLRLSTSFNLRRTTFREVPPTDPEPADAQPQGPRHGWFNTLRTTISYADLERYPQSISIEEGFSGFVSLSVQNEALGADYESLSLDYGFRLFYPNPWIDRHVLRLRLRGGIGRSELGTPIFGLGGYRSQDVLTSVIFQQPRRQFVLRGYPPGYLAGSQFQLWKFGYRFPLVRIERGVSTVPIFVRRLKGEIFADAGGAFSGLLANADLRSSVGVQLQLGAQFGYYLGGSLRGGVARGLGEGGITEFFLQYGGGF